MVSGVRARVVSFPIRLPSRVLRCALALGVPVSKERGEEGGRRTAVVVAAVGCVPCLSVRPPPPCSAHVGFPGLSRTETGLCDSRVALRVFRRSYTTPRCRCRPRSGAYTAAGVPAASSAWAVWRPSHERRKRGAQRTRKKEESRILLWGRACVRRAKKGASPPVPLLWLLRRHPCLLRSEPRPGEGASVARWRPPPRVAVSSSTSAAPAAEGGWGAECPTLPPPPLRPPSLLVLRQPFFLGPVGLVWEASVRLRGAGQPRSGGGPTMPCGAGARHARFPSSRRLDGERWGSVRARESRPCLLYTSPSPRD